MTRKELAEKSGISAVSIAKYENNERKPKIETLQKIAAALNTNFAFLTSENTDVIKNILADLLDSATDIQNTGMENIKNSLFTLSDSADNALTSLRDNTLFLESRLKTAYDSLNTDGQIKAIEAVEILAKVPDYQKNKKIIFNHIGKISHLLYLINPQKGNHHAI